MNIRFYRLIYCCTFLILSIQNVWCIDKLDSLKEQLHIVEDPGTKTQVFNAIFELIRYDSMSMAKTYALEALPYANRLEESAEKGMAYLNVGTAYFDERSMDSSYYYYDKALQTYESIGDTLGVILSLKDIGLNKFTMNEFVSANEYYIRALKFAEIKGLKDRIIELNNQIAFIFIKQEDIERGLSYFFRSLEANKSNINIQLVKTVFNIANAYQRAEKPDKSLQYLDTMIYYANVLEFDFGKAKAFGMKAFTLMDLGRFDEADASIDDALIIFRAVDAKVDVFQLLLAKARVSQERKDFQSMYVQIQEAEEFLSDLEDADLQLELYDAQYRCFKGLKRFEQALVAFENKSVLEDSIFKVSNAEKINELTTKYESDKKDQEIKNLSQQAQIQELEIQQRNLLLISILVFTGIMLLIVLVWNQRKEFRHKQAVTDMEQKLLRLQMNPHFLFNALGAIQNFILKNEANQAGIFLAKFSKLMRATLEFSREESVTLAEEKELLTNYIEIQRLNSGQRFVYDITIDEELDEDEVSIPPMFAQPFIENAIEHGKLGNFDDGLIEISFLKEGNKLILKIKDNGVGIEQAETRGDHKSLSTIITKERLSLLEKKFKMELNLLIENAQSNEERKGTRIQLSLPLLT